MTRPLARPTKKTAPRKPARVKVQLLTAFHCLDVGKESWTGFVRTLSLSETEAVLESPDEWRADQKFTLEFLLDNDRVAPVQAQVARVEKKGAFFLATLTFEPLPAKIRKLIAQQISR